jgi:hypothetical protein
MKKLEYVPAGNYCVQMHDSSPHPQARKQKYYYRNYRLILRTISPVAWCMLH